MMSVVGDGSLHLCLWCLRSAIMSVLELDECRLYHNHGVLDLLLFGRDRTQPEGQTLDTTKVREYYNLEKTRHQ